MTTKFGWCLDGLHAKCPYAEGDHGDYGSFCGCDCHTTEGAA